MLWLERGLPPHNSSLSAVLTLNTSGSGGDAIHPASRTLFFSFSVSYLSPPGHESADEWKSGSLDKAVIGGKREVYDNYCLRGALGVHFLCAHS